MDFGLEYIDEIKSSSNNIYALIDSERTSADESFETSIEVFQEGVAN